MPFKTKVSQLLPEEFVIWTFSPTGINGQGIFQLFYLKFSFMF